MTPDEARREIDAAGKAYTRTGRAHDAARERLATAIANGRRTGLEPAELEERAPWHRNMTVKTLREAGLTKPRRRANPAD